MPIKDEEELKLYLPWEIKLPSKEMFSYSEEISLKSFSIKNDILFGDKISQLFWIKDAFDIEYDRGASYLDCNKKIFQTHEGRFATLLQRSFKEDVENKNSLMRISYFYAVIELIVHSLYVTIHKTFKSIKENRNLPNEIRTILKVEKTDDINNYDIFKLLNTFAINFCHDINIFFNELDNVQNNDLFVKLTFMIEKYTGNTKLIYEYKSNNERCVLVYQYVGKHNEVRGLVSVSGYTDCEDATILNLTSGGTVCRDFIDLLKKWCALLNAKLVQTNLNIKKYGVDTNLFMIKEFSTLDKDIYNGVFYKKDYSCCERKIFAEENYYCNENDTMNIKFSPCEKCQLGILFEYNCGHRFKINVGIT